MSIKIVYLLPYIINVNKHEVLINVNAVVRMHSSPMHPSLWVSKQVVKLYMGS